jgi:RNA polymerase sigma-70 factor, ECF subfamily
MTSESSMPAAGLREQFAVLLARHAGVVRKIAATYCRDRDDRADLAQEIAYQLWRAYPRYDPARPFATWMYRIALNVAISHVRTASRERRHTVPYDEDLHDVAAAAVDHETRQQIARMETAIAGLDPIDRALLVLYLDDHSHRAIGEILGISETNAGTKIGRLKERLRKALA